MDACGKALSNFMVEPQKIRESPIGDPPSTCYRRFAMAVDLGPEANVDAYMATFAPAAFRKAHVGAYPKQRLGLPPTELADCPYCLSPIAPYPTNAAGRVTTKVFLKMLNKVHAHLLVHAVRAKNNKQRCTFCTSCSLLIPRSAAADHAKCPNHRRKRPFELAFPRDQSGRDAPPAASPPGSPGAFGSDTGPPSPAPSAGDDGPPSPAPSAAPEGPAPIPPAGACLSGRGTNPVEGSTLLGRVVVAAFGGSGQTARWCIDAEDGDTVGIWDMDKHYDAACARAADRERALQARDRPPPAPAAARAPAVRPLRPAVRRPAPAPSARMTTRAGGYQQRTLAQLGLDGAHYVISSRSDNYVGKAAQKALEKRHRSRQGAPRSYEGATFAMPLGFFPKEELKATASLKGVDKKHYPYLRFRGTVLAPGADATLDQQSVRFEVDNDLAIVPTASVHTYLCRDSVNKPPLDVTRFVDLSDDDDDEWVGGGGAAKTRTTLTTAFPRRRRRAKRAAAAPARVRLRTRASAPIARRPCFMCVVFTKGGCRGST
jgi:hypothetical protein